jgi:predicted component of type VI protein secretion system
MSEFTFIEQAPSQGTEHSVEAGMTIGREGCDITLGDPDVSRRHAEIQISNGTLSIMDLGSTNGTFVNGERIDQPRALQDGDEVRIGAVVWRLRAPAGATRMAGTVKPADVATPSQATTVRPAAQPAPEPETEQAAPAPAASEPAPAAPEPEPTTTAQAPAAADQATAFSPAPASAPSRGLSRGDVPQPDFAPSAIRRVVPVDAPAAFTPDTQGGRRGGSAATRGGATLFTSLVIAAATAGVLIYYITEPFK